MVGHGGWWTVVTCSRDKKQWSREGLQKKKKKNAGRRGSGQVRKLAGGRQPEGEREGNMACMASFYPFPLCSVCCFPMFSIPYHGEYHSSPFCRRFYTGEHPPSRPQVQPVLAGAGAGWCWLWLLAGAGSGCWLVLAGAGWLWRRRGRWHGI